MEGGLYTTNEHVIFHANTDDRRIVHIRYAISLFLSTRETAFHEKSYPQKMEKRARASWIASIPFSTDRITERTARLFYHDTTYPSPLTFPSFLHIHLTLLFDRFVFGRGIETEKAEARVPRRRDECEI